MGTIQKQRIGVRRGGVIGLVCAVLLAGCGQGAEGQGAAASSQGEALGAHHTTVISDFAHPDSLPHGLAGDREVVFVTQPLTASVEVLDRDTGAKLADLPAPAGGFKLPFAARVPDRGHLVLLDSGGFPSPFQPAIPVVYDYSYSYDRRHGFQASITRAVSFAGLPLVFAEDVEVVSDDLYVVSESVIGGLWLIDRHGNIAPGVVPDDPGAPLPQLGGCPIPRFDVGGLPFDVGFAPGVNALAHGARDLYFGSSCLGGVYRIPLRSLRAGSSPQARANDITTVSARPAGTLEALHGLVLDPRSEHHLYAADPFHLRLLRIDTRTGDREVVGDDPILFNFPVAVAAVPGRQGKSGALLVSSDQEYRFAAFNPAITQDEFQLPFHITEVVPAESGHDGLNGPDDD